MHTFLIIASYLCFAVAFVMIALANLHKDRRTAWAAGTSALGASIPVEGLLLQVSNAASSPNSFFVVANITEFAFPLGAKTVDQTNVTMQWESMIPTLKTYGKVSFKVNWVMEEPTHMNALGGGATASGLRALYLANPPALRQWLISYPEAGNPEDAFMAYVTGFAITGKVAGIFEATIELTVNDQSPGIV